MSPEEETYLRGAFGETMFDRLFEGGVKEFTLDTSPEARAKRIADLNGAVPDWARDNPHYKGRAFNKMINHGAKGQYQRRSSSKLRFNGVEELIIPSWYTSRACLKHRTILAKSKRQGERITLTCCGHEDHADLHAAQTIACYPMLQPKRIAAQVAIREKL